MMGLQDNSLFKKQAMWLMEVDGQRDAPKERREAAYKGLCEAYMRCHLDEKDYILFDVATQNHLRREDYRIVARETLCERETK